MASLTPPVCRIVADTFESASGVPDEVLAAGVDVQITSLPTGDYDPGREVLVERKTVADLHLSLEQGRLWVRSASSAPTRSFPTFLSGHDLDDGSLSPTGVRGAVMGQGVALVRSVNSTDSALWLRLLVQRTCGVRLGRDRPSYAQRLKPPLELVPEAMLAVVPGISVARARAMLGRFGSVLAIVTAGERDWLEVPGIGPKRAAALRSAVF